MTRLKVFVKYETRIGSKKSLADAVKRCRVGFLFATIAIAEAGRIFVRVAGELFRNEGLRSRFRVYDL